MNERVELLFYEVITKGNRKMMKPIDLNTTVPISVVKAILDNTIVDTFYERLENDMRARGVKPGTKVQLRAKFSKSNATFNPEFKGTVVLCEVVV
jgi:hypothetical protein